MKFADKVRSFDSFGVPVGLRMAGKSSYMTTGGGLISFAFKVFILSYSTMQLVAVVGYSDP